MDRTAYNALLAQYTTPEVSGEGQVSWEGGVKCIIPSVKLYGKCEQDGTPAPDSPGEIKCNNGTVQSTSADGTYSGGTATAPELLAIPDTEYRDEWDAQTGRGIRRCRKIVLDPSKYTFALNYSGPKYSAFFALENGAYISDCVSSQNNSGAICSHGNGVGAVGIGAGGLPASYGHRLYFLIDNALTGIDTADATNIKNGKVLAWVTTQYEAGTPVEIVYALAAPEPFAAAPARLTMPSGPGQIIQTGGDVAECPITARYLTHS